MRKMLSTRQRLTFFIAGLVLIAISLACGFGASAPGNQSAAPAPTFAQPSSGLSTSTPVPSIEKLMPEATQSAAAIPVAPPAIPEYRRLTLEFPPQIRVGDSDIIRLTLEVNTLGNVTPTAVIEGNKVTGGVVQIPNLYDTHNVIAEARLDLAGPDVRPTDAIDEPLLPGQSVTFFWSVHPVSAGTYRGTVWLSLIFVDKVSEAESRLAVAAQPIAIEATNFFGLSGGAARTFGGIGSAIGAILGFPFATDILKWLWDRVRHKES
ncbi:MAG: hypothetical protein M1282_16515 [Chloroflexi bacterium]|nr:hypothetical protein [Chloroflexota bacterium]